MNDFTILDTPGLNDPKMMMAVWAAKFNDSSMRGRKVALVLVVHKAKLGPDVLDVNNMMVIKEAIDNL